MNLYNTLRVVITQKTNLFTPEWHDLAKSYILYLNKKSESPTEFAPNELYKKANNFLLNLANVIIVAASEEFEKIRKNDGSRRNGVSSGLNELFHYPITNFNNPPTPARNTCNYWVSSIGPLIKNSCEMCKMSKKKVRCVCWKTRPILQNSRLRWLFPAVCCSISCCDQIGMCTFLNPCYSCFFVCVAPCYKKRGKANM